MIRLNNTFIHIIIIQKINSNWVLLEILLTIYNITIYYVGIQRYFLFYYFFIINNMISYTYENIYENYFFF